MEEDVKTFGDYVAILKRRALYFLLPFIVLVGGSVSVAMFLPPIYESKATILIESQQIPRDLVRSTVTSFADERIQVIKQRVMTSSTLVDIINKFDPDIQGIVFFKENNKHINVSFVYKKSSYTLFPHYLGYCLAAVLINVKCRNAVPNYNIHLSLVFAMFIALFYL